MQTDSSRNRRSLKVRIDQRVRRLFLCPQRYLRLYLCQGVRQTPLSRTCVITCKRAVISTLLPSLDERQVRQSYNWPSHWGKRKRERAGLFRYISCLSLFPPFLSLSLQLSPVDCGSLFQMCLCLQDRSINCGAKVSRPHLGQIYTLHPIV